MALARDIQILYSRLKVGTLLPEPVIFATFHFKFIFNFRQSVISHSELGVQVHIVLVAFLEHSFDPVDLHLGRVDLNLLLLKHDLGLFVYCLLIRGDSV